VRTATFKAESQECRYEKLADFAVGILDRLPLDSLEIRDVRFGIERIVVTATGADEPYMQLNELPFLGEASVELVMLP
jgi:hypothetical protein